VRVQAGFAWVAALLVVAGCGDRPPLLFRGSWPDAGPGRDVERLDRPPVDVVPCLPGPDAATCSAPGAGCGPREICNNGIDDDCDHFIDLDCDCVPGAVEPCSYGTPGQRGVGRCRIGTHRCMGAGATGRWGACEDSIGPAAEVCNGLDDDCDGCVDESLCCHNDFTCPGPGDPRVPDGRPLSPYPLRGRAFFPRGAWRWQWTVRGGACDELLGRPTFTLTGADTEDAVFTPLLSGDYAVTLRVTGEDSAQECVFVVHVGAPGLRVELCWDTSATVDLDLYLHAPDNTEPWFRGTEGPVADLALPTSCNPFNCAATVAGPLPRVDWGLAASPLAACEDGPSGPAWRAFGACANPRIDLARGDDAESHGRPENINVDVPRDGQRFRVMVANFSGGPARPIVNVFCGGRRWATVGAPPGAIMDFAGDPGRLRLGAMWRALDVTVRVDATGATTGCDVAPLHPPGAAAGPWITRGDPSY